MRRLRSPHLIAAGGYVQDRMPDAALHRRRGCCACPGGAR
jgi:hypothetical protein